MCFIMEVCGNRGLNGRHVTGCEHHMKGEPDGMYGIHNRVITVSSLKKKLWDIADVKLELDESYDRRKANDASIPTEE